MSGWRELWEENAMGSVLEEVWAAWDALMLDSPSWDGTARAARGCDEGEPD